MTINHVARICGNALHDLFVIQGQINYPTWDEMTTLQKSLICESVKYHLANPKFKPSESFTIQQKEVANLFSGIVRSLSDFVENKG